MGATRRSFARWVQRVARTLAVAGALVACGPMQSPDVAALHEAGASPEVTSARDAGASTVVHRTVDRRAPLDDGQCESVDRVHAEEGVRKRGPARGPAILQLWSTRRGRWLGATRTRLCASDDGGASFRERIVLPSPGELSLAQIERREGWLAVAREERDARAGQVDGPRAVIGAWVSSDEEARSFEALPLPSVGDQRILEVFTDRLGTIYATTARALFRREREGDRWEGPLALPGRAARAVDACGRVLLAQSTVDEQGSYWFRSFDQGRRWSPFRLGVLGIDGDRAVIRCLGARGAIEAGRGPLPSHWSFDGGRTWRRSAYDDRARRLARERGASAVRCRQGPADTIECLDEARTRLVEGSTRDVEIYAPGRCESVTALDTRTTVAFGPSCGILVSRDRGGLWRQQSSAALVNESTEDDGRGGFVDHSAAWRLDGSVWWSFNGGARWAPVASVIGRTLERGVFVDRLRGVFVTSTGWVVATRDGGRNWTYVLRGEVERVSAEGTMVYVTTPSTVRVSPDGGVHWWLPGVGASGARLRSTVEREGETRLVRLADGLRVEQRSQRIEAVSRAERTLIATIDDPRTVLLAADQDPRAGLRVLLSDGTVLSRPSLGAARRPSSPIASAVRRRRM
jgi:photosystem II stability/assembly factor-like uncharacterized protein